MILKRGWIDLLCKNITNVLLNRCSFLRKFIYYLRRYNYVKAVEKRKKLCVFEVDILSRPLILISREHAFNDFYGHSYIIKKIYGYSQQTPLKGTIEHGYYHYNNCINTQEIDIDNKYGDVVYTYSENRKKYLMGNLPNKEVVALGPYIKYADFLLDDTKRKRIKAQLGKVLLVFPTHAGSSDFAVEFDQKNLIQEIEKYKNGFDTVVVCLYWREITMKKENIYKANGYKIVTAGHIFDFYFLDRLKTIIDLADMTMSNAIGTHIGYCISLNKPHYLYNQKSVLKEEDSNKRVNLECESKYFIAFEDEFNKIFEKEIRDNFCVYQESISQTQRAIVEKYWGK